jgi:hypothetical protein
MSLFQCEQCGAVENSALGHYHSVGSGRYKDKVKDAMKLCSECMPVEFNDGSINKKGGKWHGRFPKRIYPLGSLYTDKEGNVRDKNTHKYPDWKKRII